MDSIERARLRYKLDNDRPSQGETEWGQGGGRWRIGSGYEMREFKVSILCGAIILLSVGTAFAQTSAVPAHKGDTVSLREFYDHRLNKLKEHVDQTMLQHEKQAKEYYEARFHSIIASVETAKTASDKALETARMGIEARLAAMNEFRGSLTDQAKTYVTRSEMDLIKTRQDEVRATLPNFATRLEVIAANERQDKEISLMREFRATMEGKASQTTAMISLFLSLLAIVGTFGRFFIKASSDSNNSRNNSRHDPILDRLEEIKKKLSEKWK